MPNKVTMLAGDDASDLTDFSKLMAIRWDLVPWALVLDMNCSIETSREQRRGWLVFGGMDTVSWQVEGARLPNGLVLTGPIHQVTSGDGFIKYSVPHLTPAFDAAERMQITPHNILAIRAFSLCVLVSSRSLVVDEDWLSYEQRNDLASDHDFLEKLGRFRSSCLPS